MAENATVENPISKIKSAGKPQMGLPAVAAPANIEGNNGADPAATKPAVEGDKKTPATGDNQSGNNNHQPPADDKTLEPSEDAVKAYFEKQGIKFESIDKLKEALTAKAPPSPDTPLTDEEKQKQEVEKEKQIVAEHLSRNGTVEQYTTLKTIAASEPKALGLSKEIEDLVKEGFSEEKATEMANDRYFQLTDEEIATIENEDEKKAAIKKREIGLKKLEAKGTHIKNTAKHYLDSLAKDLADQNVERTNMEQHTANVADAVTGYQRKEKVQLGQLDGADIAPVDYEIPEEAMNLAKEYLSDAKQLNKKFFTETGAFNIAELLPIVAKAFAFQSAVKTGYLEGQHRTTEFFKGKFDSKPPGLGGGSNSKIEKGKVVSAGKPQPLVRQ